MLIRKDEHGVLAIGQAAHAWVSGQLARAWGNARFGRVSPLEEVCLGAEQHDVGMAAWDLAPDFNPDTGYPQSFMEMPITVSVQLWRAGPRRLLRQSRYAALLASMHGWRLYDRLDLAKRPRTEAELIQKFLDEQRRFQDELIASLRADPITAPAAAKEIVARNSRLVWTWDTLSLGLCLDWAPYTATRVPTAGEPVELSLTFAERPGRLSLDPWPFEADAVTVRCEGQRLIDRARSSDEMRDALAGAPWETVEFELIAPATR
jgi:Protein of unknown function (DUF3891)